MVYPGSHYEKDRQNTYAADYGCCDIKKPLDYLVRFPCQIIFDMEHHDFGIEKRLRFYVGHRHPHQIRDDTHVFH